MKEDVQEHGNTYQGEFTPQRLPFPIIHDILGSAFFNDVFLCCFDVSVEIRHIELLDSGKSILYIIKLISQSRCLELVDAGKVGPIIHRLVGNLDEMLQKSQFVY